MMTKKLMTSLKWLNQCMPVDQGRVEPPKHLQQSQNPNARLVVEGNDLVVHHVVVVVVVVVVEEVAEDRVVEEDEDEAAIQETMVMLQVVVEVAVLMEPGAETEEIGRQHL
jgi:hypothetical protein